MTNLVTRLRDISFNGLRLDEIGYKIIDEAADEIASLTKQRDHWLEIARQKDAEIERLHKALRATPCCHYSKPLGDTDDGTVGYCVDGKHCTCNLKDVLAGSYHEPTCLNTPQGEPALTSPRELPGTREPVVTAPQGNAGESPAQYSTGHTCDISLDCDACSRGEDLEDNNL